MNISLSDETGGRMASGNTQLEYGSRTADLRVSHLDDTR
jgi:hypothetical protein